MMNDPTEAAVVFLVSSVRSGSTLLRLMLDANPRIVNPGECDFLVDRMGDSGQLPQVRAYAQWLETNRIFLAKKLVVDLQLSYVELMQSFIRQLGSGGEVLVLNVHRHFHRIPFVFPSARYIHLVRDPRDVARSCIGMGWAGNVLYGVDIWRDAESSWRELRKTLSADQYLDVRYEDLLNDVKGGLKRICGFLGVDYSDLMLNYSSGSTYAPPDKNLSQQWKNRYTVRELQLVEGRVGTWLSECGYPSSGHGPATPEWLESIWMYLQNRAFRMQFQIRRYGIRLYLEDLLASRIGTSDWKRACQKKKNDFDIKHLK